jgi:hypothetical protein
MQLLFIYDTNHNSTISQAEFSKLLEDGYEVKSFAPIVNEKGATTKIHYIMEQNNLMMALTRSRK